MRTLYKKYVMGAGKLHDVQLLLFRIMLVVIFTTHISNGFAAGGERVGQIQH
jgi:hypothetical protein